MTQKPKTDPNTEETAIDVAALRAALNADLRDSLPGMTLALGVLFTLFAISHAFLIPDPGAKVTMTVVAALTAVINYALSLVLRRRSLPPRWAHPVGTGLALVMLFNMLLHLYLTRDPLQTTNVLLLIVGAGFVMYATGWWLAVIGVSFAGWLFTASRVGPYASWTHFGFAMISALVVSVLVHLVRRRTSLRLERLRIQDENRQVKLELALRSAEQVQRALETTVGVAQRITSILDLDALLNQVAALIKDRYGYYYVGIYLIDESGEFVEARAGTGEVGRKLRESGFRLPLGENSIIGWVARHREIAIVNNVEQDARFMPGEDVPDTRSELALPLESGGDMLGVLDIQSDKLWAFNTDDVSVLEALAAQVAVAIQNAAQYQTERARRMFAEKLYDVGRALSRTLDLTEVLELILQQLSEIVPFDRGSVMLERGEGLIIVAATGFPEHARPDDVRVPISEGDVYYTLRQTLEAELVPDVSQRADWQYVPDLPPARSWLGVPLILDERVIGMFSLTRERPDPYTEGDVTLSSAFASQAAIALENARLYDNLSNVNVQLEETVEQLRQRTEDLQITYAQLERLDRTKSDFISVASHELRTPLTVMSGYTQILSKDPKVLANEYQHQLVEGIGTGIARLHTIVDSMLDMAKIDSRELQLHPESMYLATVLHSIRSKLAENAEARNITLTVEESIDALPKIEGDIEGLRKVFYHLMINSVKYTPDGGSVRVWGRALPQGSELAPGGGVEIVVSDTGIGVDPSVHELIFAKFYQTGEVAVHSTGDTKFKGGGPGLGLAIARGIVEAHGGKIWVESPGYDEEACPGSDFHVVLPPSARVLLETSKPVL